MGSVVSRSSNSSLIDSVGSYLEYEHIIDHLNSGDLIEVHRNSFAHWVLYEQKDHNGNVMCFHVSQVSGVSNRISKGSSDGKARIKYESLEKILRDNKSLTPSLCRINNQSNIAQEKIKTTGSGTPDIKQVFQKLHNMKDTTVKYDLKSLNCEHYSTLWKYGIGWSSQVNSYEGIAEAALKFHS